MSELMRGALQVIVLSWLVGCGADKGAKEGRDADADIDADAHADPPEDMILVPRGAFWMGCNAAEDPICMDHPDEAPYHQVILSAFAIDRTEVTQRDYYRCIAVGKCPVPEYNYDPTRFPDLPAPVVTWEAAND